MWDDEILANAAFAGVVAAGRRVPALVPAAGADVGARRSGARTWTDHSHRVFVSRRRVRFLEMEYAIPREDAAAVLAELRRVHEASDWRVGVPGRGAGGRGRRHPAVDGVRARHRLHRRARAGGQRPRALVRGAGVDRRRRSAAGRTGESCTASTPTALRARYPRFDEFVAVRDRLDPTGVLANAYLDRVLGPVGTPPAS